MSRLLTLDAHIERARPAVAGMRGLEAGHVTAEFRQSQPLWNLLLEHAALAEIVARTATLAGNHQDELHAVALHPAQKRKQRGVGLGLRLAVKIDAGIERLAPARKPLLEPPFERLEPRRWPTRDGGGGCQRMRFCRRRRFAGRLRRNLVGRSGLSPQRCDRAHDLAPQLALLGFEPAGA